MTSHVELADRLSYCAGRDASDPRVAARCRPDRNVLKHTGPISSLSTRQPRCHSECPGRRMKSGRQPARARTKQRVPADKVRRSGRPKTNSTPTLLSDRAKLFFTPSAEGMSRLPWTRSRSLDGFSVQMRSSPRDWPKGAPSPLIGPGGMAAATADCPSNRESNIVLRGLRSLAERRQPRSHPRIGRERRQVLLNSAHRERYGVSMERRCCCSCW